MVGTGGLGDGIKVPQWGPGADPRWGSEGFSTRNQICIHNLQWTNAFSWCVHRTYTVYLQAHAKSANPPPYSSKKLFEFVQISRLTLAKVGWARAHPCSTVATPLAMLAFDRVRKTDFLFHFYRKYTFILYPFWVIANYLSKFADFNIPHLAFGAPVAMGWPRSNFTEIF